MTLKRIFFFSGSEYWRYDWTKDGAKVDAVDTTRYPRSIAGPWRGLFPSGIDAAFCWRNGQAYLFSGDQYVRYNALLDQVDDNYPMSIGDMWGGVRAAGFDRGIDAALHWGNGQVYWFKGDKYIRLAYDSAADRWDMEPTYPKPIAGNWTDVAGSGFERDISGCVNWGDGNIFWFKGDKYIRLVEEAAPRGKSRQAGYPKLIIDAWPGVPTTGFDACLEWPYAELAPGTFAMPSGAQPIAGRRASVAMNVDFVAGPHPGYCAVGEYHQLVRGAFTRGGVDQRFPLANPRGGTPVDFHRTEFREDGIPTPGPGITTFYGHRQPRFAGEQADNTDANDQYLPDRLTGCQYRGLDSPGPLPAEGLTAEFISQALDQGSDGEVLASSTWTVTIPE